MSVEEQNVEAAVSNLRSGNERRSVFNRRRRIDCALDGRGDDRRKTLRRALLSKFELAELIQPRKYEPSLLEEAAEILVRCRDKLLYAGEARITDKEINAFLEKIK